ncbi:DJ-1/PfpI domain-containing protein [Madurella fahalii]|uniref:DJ-1/PfpI domain-containing protein n=1 Tax=Madurella fahalii TaxID=1157608 RepID=A0ABQ0G6G5_9PEZI
MLFPAAPRAKLLTASLALLLTSLSFVNPTAAKPIATRTCRSENNTATAPAGPGPTHYGILLPQALAPLDVFGPLEVFQALARSTHLQLSVLARSLDPVSSGPTNDTMNRFNSTFWPSFVPTHTYADDPDIQVLLIPGGGVARSPDLGPEIEYVRKVFPRLEYLITICTGSGIAAQAGVLDGYRATTNKRAWAETVKKGPNVKWVSPARWVDDGKVWSSSGVTAGIDLAFAFLEAKYPNGTAMAEFFSSVMEHERILDWRHDPYAEKLKIPPTNN